MENPSAPNIVREKSTFKILLVIFLLVLVLSSVMKEGGYPIVIIIGSAIFLWSVVSCEVNLAFFLISVHSSAMLNPHYDAYVSVARWVFLGLLAFRVYITGLSEGPKAPITLFNLGVLLFVFIACYSNIGAFAQPVCFYRTISLCMFYSAIFVMSWRYLDTREKITEWMKIIGVVGSVFMLLGYADWQSNLLEERIRIQGVYLSPNALGLAMVALVPVNYYLYRYYKFRGSRLYKTIFLALFVVSIIQVILSGSRASILGLVIGLALSLYFIYRGRLTITLILIGFVVAFGYANIKRTYSGEFFQSVVLRKTTFQNVGGRDEIWKLGMELFKRRPFLGYGFGTNDYVISARGDPNLLDVKMRFGMHAHNSMLRSLLEVGLVGTSILVLFFIVMPFKILNMLARAPTEELFVLILALGVITIASMVNSFFESWLFSVGSIQCFIFWWSAAMLYKIDLDMRQYVLPTDKPIEFGVARI